MKGFEFEGAPTFVPGMKKYIGKIGKIKTHYKTKCWVDFDDGDGWNYPYPEILQHLVEELPEQEITIEQILNNIKNLTKQI